MAHSVSTTEVPVVYLACEAGMGSSLMSVNALKKKLKKAKVKDVTVKHVAARAIPADAKLIVVHKGLAKVAQRKAPDAVVVAFKQFLNDPVFDVIVRAFVEKGEITSNLE